MRSIASIGSSGVMSASAPTKLIAQNRRARHNYLLEKKFEAGIALEGWEVKSLRAGRAQIADAYVMVREGVPELHGVHISPLQTASTHKETNPARSRNLLLHTKEINEIRAAIATRGRACPVLSLYWKEGRVKCEIAIGTGKKTIDKRRAIKDRDQKREARRLLRRE